MVMTSGSTYVIGGAFGPKSRGGVVIVLAGPPGSPAGGACPSTQTGASAAVPAIALTAPMNFLREMPLPFAMSILLIAKRRVRSSRRRSINMGHTMWPTLPMQDSQGTPHFLGRTPLPSLLWPCSHARGIVKDRARGAHCTTLPDPARHVHAAPLWGDENDKCYVRPSRL